LSFTIRNAPESAERILCFNEGIVQNAIQTPVCQIVVVVFFPQHEFREDNQQRPIVSNRRSFGFSCISVKYSRRQGCAVGNMEYIESLSMTPIVRFGQPGIQRFRRHTNDTQQTDKHSSASISTFADLKRIPIRNSTLRSQPSVVISVDTGIRIQGRQRILISQPEDRHFSISTQETCTGEGTEYARTSEKITLLQEIL
jgi:hypothetical protein